MFFTKENETLSLPQWEYTACLIINALAALVKKGGGRVAPRREGFIENRTHDEKLYKLESRIAALEEARKERQIDEEALKEYVAKRDELKAIGNKPKKATGTFIQFVLDDMYYSFSFNENLFFPFYLTKTPVVDGEYAYHTYLQETSKKWMDDYNIYSPLTQADIEVIAAGIYKQLLGAPQSRIERKHVRKQVPNTYSEGFHTESISEVYRRKVDF